MVDKSPQIILFDGVCSICDRSMRFIIKRDPKKKFRFATLQSELGQRLFMEHSIPNDIETMVLIKNDKAYIQSEAVLRIAKELNGFWPIFAVLQKLPLKFRDYAYKMFSENRYKLFGKSEQCSIPSKEQRSRFLSQD